jgi:hypothetical protein
MITMEMADENVIYFAESDMIFPELHLGTFAAVYQIKALMRVKHMSAGISF